MILKKSTKRAEINQFDQWYPADKISTFPLKVQKELRKYKRGLVGEADAAHHLDREFLTTKDHILIHDLRISDENGSFAQFDHLVMSRLSKTISIFEVKNFSGRISKNDHGEWLVWYAGQRHPQDIPNPVEQARRQRTVLQRWIRQHKLEDFFPTIGCFVVIPAKCAIDRKAIKSDEPIYKADNVVKEWREFGGISPLGRLFSFGLSPELLLKNAQALVRAHEEQETTIFHRLNVLPDEVKAELEAIRLSDAGMGDVSSDQDVSKPTRQSDDHLGENA